MTTPEPPAGARVAVVTGGAGGIGSAVVRRLLGDGYRLVLVDRPGPALDALATGLIAAGYDVLAFGTDVRDPDEAERIAAEASDRLGGIDVLVTCAGSGQVNPVQETTDAIWRDTLDTNLSGTFWWCRAVVPRLRARGGGVIVTVSSVVAMVGLPGRAAYAAAKAGVIGLARTLAIECAPDRIRVIPVCPGATRTDLIRQAYARTDDPDAAERRHASLQPIGRLSEPEEIAEAIAFVCSARAATFTGAPLVIDGGYTAGGPSWNT